VHSAGEVCYLRLLCLSLTVCLCVNGRILIIAEGRVAYLGAASEICDFFSSYVLTDAHGPTLYHSLLLM